jgi:hypothetical protein
MGARAPRKVRSVPARAMVQVRVAGLQDGFLEVMPEEKKRPVREKVVRKLRQLHPMD